MSVHRIRTGDDTFRAAIDAMTSARQRPEFAWHTIPAPSRMAPSTWACTGEILVHDEELASGRLVVLHDPAGQESWDGTSRMVALVQAQLARRQQARKDKDFETADAIRDQLTEAGIEVADTAEGQRWSLADPAQSTE